MPNPITIPVTVNESTDPWTLVVNGNSVNNQTDVSENSVAQTLQWNLQLAAGQTGTFNALSQSDTSGFSWTSSPAPAHGIFLNLTEPSAQNGTQIQVSDLASGPSARGTWTYKLCATVNGNPCETNPSAIRGVPGDPSIKNR